MLTKKEIEKEMDIMATMSRDAAEKAKIRELAIKRAIDDRHNRQRKIDEYECSKN
jgi:hypothetical protein